MPLEICNAKIVEARRMAKAEEQRLQNLYAVAAREEFSPPVDASVVEFSLAQRAHADKPANLRMTLRNFDPERFTANVLDVPENKTLLQDGLNYLKAKHAESLKRKATPVVVAPKRSGLVAAIEGLFGDPIAESAPAFPAPRPPPQGGLFGAPPPLDIYLELKRAEEAIREFPISESYEQAVARLNLICSALKELEPRKEEPIRQDRGWTVPSRWQ
jgi:hypothetical protein